jgi:hypothetical protein
VKGIIPFVICTLLRNFQCNHAFSELYLITYCRSQWSLSP